MGFFSLFSQLIAANYFKFLFDGDFRSFMGLFWFFHLLVFLCNIFLFINFIFILLFDFYIFDFIFFFFIINENFRIHFYNLFNLIR
mmetsp:Transcript_47635/g.64625  ORF Transcript_47635/g.64625 Transcript_47635/m.64625 type:complete len:86 (+) Transcript_47635:2089-2346(+)